MSLESTVRDTVVRHQMLRDGDRVLVAVSGGADSTALLHLLHGMARERRLRLHVAHLDHGWRGAESAADRAFVEEMAASLDLPCTAETLASRASGGRTGEAPAREVRLRFLEDAARRAEARRIVTGHTLDDQAETVLLRLLRGAGARGLGAIPPVRGPYVRPLIACARRDIEAWLRERGIAWREDSTNRDRALERNRVRHELMPRLEGFRPGAAARLAATADLLREDDDCLEEWAGERYREAATLLPGGISLELSVLRHLPRALSRRVLRRALREAGEAAYPPPRPAVERLRDLMAGFEDGPIDLPGGIRAGLEQNAVVLRGRGSEIVEGFCEEVAVPGRVSWPEAGISLSVQEVDRTELDRNIKDAPRNVAYLDMERTGRRLVLRNRRAGDEFHPLGLGGRKKIQDFLVDAQVPRAERERVAVLTSEGNIVWLVGHRIDDRYRITDTTRKVLVATLGDA